MLLNNDVSKNKDLEILKTPLPFNDKIIKILLGNKCIHNDIS